MAAFQSFDHFNGMSPIPTLHPPHYAQEQRKPIPPPKPQRNKQTQREGSTESAMGDHHNDNEEEKEHHHHHHRHVATDEEDEEDEDDDDEDAVLKDSTDSFFESLDRVPSGVSIELDLPSSTSSEDDEDDVRISFASAVGGPSFRRISFSDDFADEDDIRVSVSGNGSDNFDYGLWMAEPVSVKERRRRLLQGMGLASRKDMPVPVPVPVKTKTHRRVPSCTTRSRSVRPLPPIAPTIVPPGGPTHSPPPPPPPTTTTTADITTIANPTTNISRSKSDSELPALRAEASPVRRSSSLPSSFSSTAMGVVIERRERGDACSSIEPVPEGKVKSVDDDEELVSSDHGTVGRLNETQSGLLTMEEFEKFLGFSPIVKELMRRANIIGSGDKDKKKSNEGAVVAAQSKAPSNSKHSGGNGGNGRKRGSWLKNIKFVASSVTGLISDKDKDGSNASERMKVHQHGKSYKELTGLYMCQEIQAHQGSIWTIKFSWDSRYLASAGEDRTVHVWEVLECSTLSSSFRGQDQNQSSSKPPLPNGASSLDQGSQHSKRTKKGKVSSANRRNSIRDHIVMPETFFSLSQKPVCSFEGHLDDVLDLSWSKSQYLLSSSMDKTVRLWDMETKACLKLFAHNDYVTCIQFNPTDDKYFISGSLDAKVRIWSIPDRQVVDWTDLHEMVTAACYTPDGKAALVGSHKGSCRFYNTSDSKLCQEGQIDIRNKKRKSNAKKITGFQFAPDNPSQVLITSADSQIRVFNGVDMIHKFRGFRNTSSQISASFSLDGRYVVCASEDSHVYIWKRDTSRGATGGRSKGLITTRSHEHFYCKDVSVAIPWPCGGSNYEPSPSLPSWSRRHADDIESNLEDNFPSGRSSPGPPLPKKSFSGELRTPLRSGSGLGGSASLRSGSGSGSGTSSSFSSSWGWGGNSSRMGGGPEKPDAWGMVVVTAGLDGNIRVYQNFGMPLRLSRQPNLF